MILNFKFFFIIFLNCYFSVNYYIIFMDNVNRIFDKINTNVENPFSETEGINQMEFKRDSAIKLPFLKNKKKKNLSIANNNNYYQKGNLSSRYKVDFKRILKLLKEQSKNKNNPNIKFNGKLKLTPFQKMINESKENKKILEYKQKKNDSSNVNIVLQSISNTNPPNSRKYQNIKYFNNSGHLYLTPKKKKSSNNNVLSLRIINYSLDNNVNKKRKYKHLILTESDYSNNTFNNHMNNKKIKIPRLIHCHIKANSTINNNINKF